MLRRGVQAALLAIVCWMAAELFLRAFHHEVLPQAVSNEVATRYHTGFGGIYAWDPEMRSPFFRKGIEQRMYYNGYRWWHRGDSRGFRNPVERSRADVVLVGDSMVYGHGVEEEDTIRHRLEERIGRPVANLGMQGASAHLEYQVVKRYAVAMRPRHLFVFFLNNDVEDLLLLSDEEMMRFVRAPAEQLDVAYFDVVPLPPPTLGSRVDHLLEGLYSFRALRVLAHLVQSDLLAPSRAHAARRPPAFRRNPRMSLAFLFHQMAVKRMHGIARDHAIELVHVFLYTGQARRGEDFYEEVLGRFCASEGIPFLSLRPPIAAALDRGEEPFLPNDGHLSPQGAGLVAQSLADWIERREAAAG